MYKSFSIAGRRYRLDTVKAKEAAGKLIGATVWAACWAWIFAEAFARIARWG